MRMNFEKISPSPSLQKRGAKKEKGIEQEVVPTLEKGGGI